jgi:hypothetical protein
MTIRPISASEANTKLVRLEDNLRAFAARLHASGFDKAAREVAYIIDYCLDPVRDGLERDV